MYEGPEESTRGRIAARQILLRSSLYVAFSGLFFLTLSDFLPSFFISFSLPCSGSLPPLPLPFFLHLKRVSIHIGPPRLSHETPFQTVLSDHFSAPSARNIYRFCMNQSTDFFRNNLQKSHRKTLHRKNGTEKSLGDKKKTDRHMKDLFY